MCLKNKSWEVNFYHFFIACMSAKLPRQYIEIKLPLLHTLLPFSSEVEHPAPGGSSDLCIYTKARRLLGLLSTCLKPRCTSVLSYIKLSKLFYCLCRYVALFECMKYNWRLESLHIPTTGKGELIKSLTNSPHPNSTLPFSWPGSQPTPAGLRLPKPAPQLLRNVGPD